MTDKEKRALFNTWVQEYANMIYSVAYRLTNDHTDADDVVQNTFLKAWKYFDSFSNQSSVSTWLYKIAMNEAIDWKKKNTEKWETGLDPQEVLVNVSSSSYVDFAKGEEKFNAALNSLPPKQKAVFVMKFFDDKTYEEIEAITGTSIGALKASYFNAKKKIEDFFESN